MDIRKLLHQEHSLAATLNIASWIEAHPEQIGELMRLYFDDDPELARRAAWAAGTLAKRVPGLFTGFLPDILAHLERPGLHDAIVRNGMKIFEMCGIPETLRGRAASSFFRIVSDPGKAVAIRCYALTALAGICMHEPELIRELELILDKCSPDASAGLRSRIRKTRALLYKIHL